MIRRHRLVEYFLHKTLGIAWHEVHNHAHVLEHGLTPLVEEKLAEFLGHPQACPHGTPMPGIEDVLPENLKTGVDVAAGDKIKIVIIEEMIEDQVELMKFLEDKSIVPGEVHTVLEKMDVTHTIVLQQGDQTTTIPFDIAENIKIVKI